MNQDAIQREIQEHFIHLHPRRADEIKSLAGGDSLFERGLLDSLSLLDFVAFLEKRYQLQVGTEDFVQANFASLESAAAFVASRLRG